jgi:tetratricopeptide (TPR) repeat protein
MGKKKAANKNDPEALKEAGNKSFIAGNYAEAIKNYTLAIEIQPNHIYYSNRANAHLELNQFDECIEDCKKSLELDKTFAKSYYR